MPTLTKQHSNRFTTWMWTALDQTDTDISEVAVLDANYSDIMVEFDDTGGDWGGETFTLRGYGYEFVNGYALSDLDGSAISLTADGAATIREAPYSIKPVAAGSGTSTSITCRLTARRVSV